MRKHRGHRDNVGAILRIAHDCYKQALGEDVNKVQAKTKSVRELLSNVKYDIDFYQRDYVWR